MGQGSVSFRLLNSFHCPSVGEKVIIFFLEQKLVLEKNSMTKVQSPSGSRSHQPPNCEGHRGRQGEGQA